jgi:hypothetical protein
MTLAYDYPLLGVFWSLMIFYIVFIWIIALFRVIGDIFSSHDMGGFAKALWLIFVIVVPFLGVFCYLIARGGKMAEHAAQRQQAQEAAFTNYVQQTAGTSGPADQLAQLAKLRDSGSITDAEFEAGKAKILA